MYFMQFILLMNCTYVLVEDLTKTDLFYGIPSLIKAIIVLIIINPKPVVRFQFEILYEYLKQVKDKGQ